MDENPEPSNGRLLLAASPQNVQMAPGSRITIQVRIKNRQAVEDLVDLSIQGVPIEWVALDQHLVRLGAGEQRNIELVLTVPDSPDLHPNRFPFKIQAASQGHPGVAAAVSGEMVVAAYQSEGRIGVMLGRIVYGAAPGGQVVIPVLLQNRGLAADTFHLEVRDIPSSWVTTADAFTTLEPGEQKEITFTVLPPRYHESKVGPLPFTIAIDSQLAPSEPELVKVTLDLAPFSAFASRMEPNQILANAPAFVSVRNDGNIADVFLVEFLSQDAGLVFEKIKRSPSAGPSSDPNQPQETYTGITQPEVLRIQPGKSDSVEFRARSRKPPLFGREYSLSFSTRVVSSRSKLEAVHTGTFSGQALIPVWVPLGASLVVLLLLCVIMVAALANQNRASRESLTAQAGTAMMLALSQTPTNTPGLLTASPAIPVTGLTATPSFTPITPLPTATLTSNPPTLISTQAPPTPSFTSPPPTLTPLPPTATFTVQPPTATVAPTAVPATATIPPIPALTGTIVFQSNRDGNPEIYALDNATQKVTRLTANQAVDSQPAIAPDGVRVAYVSNQTSNNEIFLTSTDLHTPVNLSNNPADDQQPAWSPDGQSIAFTTNRDGNSEIYIMRADGSQVHNLTNNAANDFSPSWFVTGGLLDRQEWIAFTSNRDGNEEIYIVKPDGTGLKDLTNNSANDYSPSGSSNLIAFVSERDGNQEIYTMSIDGSVQTDLTKNPGRDYDPVISPDGNWIAFTSERDGNPEIYVMRTDGSNVANLTRSSAQDSHPSWR